MKNELTAETIMIFVAGLIAYLLDNTGFLAGYAPQTYAVLTGIGWFVLRMLNLFLGRPAEKIASMALKTTDKISAFAFSKMKRLPKDTK